MNRQTYQQCMVISLKIRIQYPKLACWILGYDTKGDNLLTSSLHTMELVIFLTFIISILLFGAWAGKITLPLIPSLLQASENDRP